MTTPEAARTYEAEHLAEWAEKGWAIHNPHDKPVGELPAIYGFNNGGQTNFLHAQLLAEDGTMLGSHCCSAECYMPFDLGVLDGSSPSRHETFRKHYPDGYRMEFVGYADVGSHPGIQAAAKIAREKAGMEA